MSLINFEASTVQKSWNFFKSSTSSLNGNLIPYTFLIYGLVILLTWDPNS